MILVVFGDVSKGRTSSSFRKYSIEDSSDEDSEWMITHEWLIKSDSFLLSS